MSQDDLPKAATPGAQGVEPTAADAQAIQELVRRVGEAKAALLLRADRLTLARIAARWSVREGTLFMVRRRLAEAIL